MLGGSARPNHILGNLDQLERLNFQTLAFDIHTSILHFVSPRDLIALRKTCKAMAEVTSFRTIWVNALMRMCFENSAITHSFSVSKMSLLELEYAAMGPERWVAAMARAHSQKLEFLPVYKIHRPFPQPDYLSSLDQIFLIPGGRYLLTRCEDAISILDLLDTLESIPGYFQDFIANPMSDGLGIRVGAIEHSRESSFVWSFHYEIHNFIFGEENPTFSKIDGLSIQIICDTCFASICDDRLIVVDGVAIKVWNFVTDEWATWLTDVVPLQIIVSGDFITFIGRDRIFLWDIPPLHSNARAFFTEPYADEAHVPRRFIIKYSDFQLPNFSHELECTTSCDWYTGTINSFWFDVCVKAQGARLSFHRFELQLNHDDLLSSTLRPIRKYYYPVPFDSRIPPYRISGGKAFIWWQTENVIKCTLGPMNEEDADGEDCRINLLNTIDFSHEVTICPISGRLCYVCHFWNTIKIIDFLTPPSTSPNNT